MQVSNWFINARVRLWRPLIFKICEEEDPEAPALTSVRSPERGKGEKGPCAAKCGALGADLCAGKKGAQSSQPYTPERLYHQVVTQERHVHKQLPVDAGQR